MTEHPSPADGPDTVAAKMTERLVRALTNGLCPADGPCEDCDCFDPQHRRERAFVEVALPILRAEAAAARATSGAAPPSRTPAAERTEPDDTDHDGDACEDCTCRGCYAHEGEDCRCLPAPEVIAEGVLVAKLPRSKYRVTETPTGWSMYVIDGEAGGWGQPSAACSDFAPQMYDELKCRACGFERGIHRSLAAAAPSPETAILDRPAGGDQ